MTPALSATAALQRFLGVLAPSGGLVELRALPSRAQAFCRRDDAEAVTAFIDAHATENLYLGVATRLNASSGSLENCGSLNVLFVDIDFKVTPETDARKALAECPFQPSIVVHSGGGLHAYWLLNEGLDLTQAEERQHARNLLRRLALFLHADLSSAEPARILRLPWTRNFKYVPPRDVTIESFDAERTYNVGDFDDMLPEEPAAPLHNGSGFSVPGTIKAGGRNDTLYRLGRSLKARNLSRPAITAALDAENRTKCDPPLEGGEMTAIVESVWTQPDRPEFAPRHDESPTQDAPPVSGRAFFRRISDVDAKPIRWLWKERLARGKVSMVAGNPGLGKSQIMASLAATVSTGGLWPVDRSPCESGNVVILSAEDDPADTLRPRLEAAGANLEKCFILEAVAIEGSESRRSFNMQTDLERLGEMLAEIGGAALVVIDPITAYLGKTDSHKNAEVRAVLSPLADLAAKYETAVLCVSHFNKNANSEALMRVTGSLAFVAAARAAFVVTKDPENDARRLFLPLKNNIGNDQTGLAFMVEAAQIESPLGMIETSRVSWEAAPVSMTAQEAMRPQLEGEERSELEEAKGFLRELLADGPVSSKLIRTDAEGAGHSWPTIRRAQSALGVIAAKEGMKGGWTWRLGRAPNAEDAQGPPKMLTSNG